MLLTNFHYNAVGSNRVNLKKNMKLVSYSAIHELGAGTELIDDVLGPRGRHSQW